MIVSRRAFTVKKGRTAEVLEWLSERLSPAHTRRICTSQFGTFDTLMVEEDFESLEELERTWAGWRTLPEWGPFFEKWNELTDTGGTNEIWQLEQSL